MSPPGRTDGAVYLSDRQVGYADFGPPDGQAVVWCHGGPGSRLEAQVVVGEAAGAGFRVVGIDRPGYGNSTPQPGRAIADWVDDARRVADALGLERIITVGVSTGGAYALALAARCPDLVQAAVACCALTDMRWAEGRAMMTGPSAMGSLMAGIWDAADRDEALRKTVAALGEDGSGLLAQTPETPFPPADAGFLTDPENIGSMAEGMGEMFAFGVQGFVDDRIADGVGWASFDAAAVRCPVVVLHGSADPLVPVAQAHHTASLLSRAQTRVVEDLGHFSITTQIVPTLRDIVASTV